MPSLFRFLTVVAVIFGIGYGIVFCELLLAPVTPSNTARAGGIIPRS